VKLNIVPARTGIQWVKLGVQTFLKQPLALAGLVFMYSAVGLVLSALPGIGILLAGMLVPAATLGLMAATAEATEGRFPMPTVLLSAFRAGRQRARAMLVLGILYAVGSLAATLLGQLAGNAPLVTPPPGMDPRQAPQLDTGTFVGWLLHMPLLLLFWHAPALVHWHGVPPAKSLFFSAVACLRNFWAFTLYSFAWGALLLVSMSVLGTLGLVLGGQALAQSIVLPTFLLVATMSVTSVYFTFRDCFIAEPEEAAPSTGGEQP
jgi:hypothetical protein